MKNFISLQTVAALTLGLFCAVAPTRAQTTVRTINGVFKTSDGDRGTYVRTVTKTGNTANATVVYTRNNDQATRTNTEITTKNDDGTRTVTVSDTDFGATAPYTAQKVVTKEKHGQFVGRGTYTTATGDTGTLTTLESKGGPVDVSNAVRNSAATGITQILNLRDREYGFTAVKRIVLLPDGTTNTTVTTRYITGNERESD